MFFDIGMGLLLAASIGWVTGTAPSGMFVVVGIVGSLWPDIDFIIWILRGKKVDHLAHQHRDLLHRPLVFTPFLTAIVWLWLGWQAGVLFGVTTLTHFTHDTIGHGWGIRWLWPLDRRYWCYRSYGPEPRRFSAWTKHQQDSLCELFGNRHWMKQGYGRWNSSLGIEITALVAGTLAVLLWQLAPLN